MKTIIAGSRGISSVAAVAAAVEAAKAAGIEVTEVLCGMARGVDLAGREWALQQRLPVQEFPAHWDEYGRSAGYIRNEEMAHHAEALIAVWDGESRGTKHMIDIAKKQGLPTYVSSPKEVGN